MGTGITGAEFAKGKVFQQVSPSFLKDLQA